MPRKRSTPWIHRWSRPIIAGIATEQKQLFGKEAFKQINYIECDPKGKNPQPNLCKAANVQGYPTWTINGQSVSGTQSLDKLAQMSGYTGNRNFKN